MKSRRLLLPAICSCLATLALAQPLAAQVIVSLDFENPADLTNNFRAVGNLNTNQGTTSNGAANDYAFVTGTGSSAIRTLIYDTTPASGVEKNVFTGPIQIDADIDTTAGATSFGIYFIPPATETSNTHLLALFNWDPDQFRIFTGGNATNSSTPGTAVYNSNATQPIDVGVNAADGFAHFTLTYRADTVDPTRAVIGMMVNNVDLGEQLLGANTYIPSYQIGLRLSPVASGQTVSFDNFVISQPVPEGSTAGLILAGALGTMLVRRKRRAL